MADERIFIQSDGLKIEALIDKSPGQKAVVVTHPHPLYGGDMSNNVVQSITSAYKQRGFTTLRFNFRGVGRSEGKIGQGTGEQQDVRSALAFLSEVGKTSIDLAGYSFGAWVNALGLANFDLVKRAVMVSPPVAFIDFSFLGYSPKIRLVISASEDNIAPPAIIKEMLLKWNPNAELKVIHGTDHFYGGSTSEVASTIKDFLDK